MGAALCYVVSVQNSHSASTAPQPAFDGKLDEVVQLAGLRCGPCNHREGNDHTKPVTPLTTTGSCGTNEKKNCKSKLGR